MRILIFFGLIVLAAAVGAALAPVLVPFVGTALFVALCVALGAVLVLGASGFLSRWTERMTQRGYGWVARSALVLAALAALSVLSYFGI